MYRLRLENINEGVIYQTSGYDIDALVSDFVNKYLTDKEKTNA